MRRGRFISTLVAVAALLAPAAVAPGAQAAVTPKVMISIAKKIYKEQEHIPFTVTAVNAPGWRYSVEEFTEGHWEWRERGPLSSKGVGKKFIFGGFIPDTPGWHLVRARVYKAGTSKMYSSPVMKVYTSVASQVSVAAYGPGAKNSGDSTAPAEVVIGDAVALKGTIWPKATGRPVTLQRWNGKAWVSLSTAKTSLGAFTLKVPTTVAGTSRYRVTSGMYRYREAVSSGSRYVAVKSARTTFTAAMERTTDWGNVLNPDGSLGPAVAMHTFTVTGTVGPARAGRTVVPEYLYEGHWYEFQNSAVVTAANGSYSVRIPVGVEAGDKAMTARVRVPATASETSAASATFVLTAD